MIAFEDVAWMARRSAGLREAILQHGRIVRLGRGEWVYGEGDREAGLVIVLHGRIRIEATIGLTRDVLLTIAGAGTVFGQSPRFGGGRRIVTARAAGTAQVFLLSDAMLGRIAATQPTIWQAVSEAVYEQLNASVRLAAFALSLGPRARIAVRLVLLADDGVVTATQAELAEMCGMSRKTANGHLALLEAAGLVTRAYGRVTVRDVAALRAMAG